MFIQNKRLHNEMETAAGEPAHPGLGLMQDRPGQPARTDDAVRFVQAFGQRVKGVRRRSPVRVHITDDFRLRSEFESLDERAAFADGRRKIQQADRGKIPGHALHDATGVVATTVEHDNELERAVVVFAEVLAELAQHRFDARFFVVRWDEQQQTGFGHAISLAGQVPDSKLQRSALLGFR
jgi:hypothetical protein